MNTLLKNVLHDSRQCDILIEGNKFKTIAAANTIAAADAKVVDCTGLAVLPPFYNAHTHAAMTLLRGYADDMPLFKWLSEYIWPAEGKLTAEDIYVGARLAILEMIRSGTVFFADMYWHREQTAHAANEMGIRANIGATIAENLDTPAHIDEHFKALKERLLVTNLVQVSVMPHAIYTCGDAMYKRCAEFAKSEGLILHTHLAETEGEVKDCLARSGKTPVKLLADLGVLGPNFVAAHCVHLTDEDVALLAESGSSIVHNPCSNLKLASGIFPMEKLLKAGAHVALGTDGASSNNNLDMHEEVKYAALLAKRENPENLPAGEALKIATRNGALAYGIDAGEIAEGRLADCLLVDMNNERLIPNYHLVSNWVYSADSRSIKHVMCNGKFIMENGYVPGQEDILEQAKFTAKKFMN